MRSKMCYMMTEKTQDSSLHLLMLAADNIPTLFIPPRKWAYHRVGVGAWLVWVGIVERAMQDAGKPQTKTTQSQPAS